jgi:hypothetical protein
MTMNYAKMNGEIFKKHSGLKLLDENDTWRDLTPDGPISTGYNAAKKRILWILREPHGGGGGSLIKEVNEDLIESIKPKWNRWYATWGLIIKVSNAILNGERELSAVHPSSLKECLSQISVINLNKFGGGSKKSKHYWSGVKLCQPIVHEQIERLNPNIIIFAGTGPDAVGSEILNLNEKPFSPGPELFPMVSQNKQLLISAYHPGQRTIEHSQYCKLVTSHTKN